MRFEQDGIHRRKLPHHLPCQDHVKRLMVVSSACHIDRNKSPDLPHDSVSETYGEGLLEIHVQFSDLGKVPVGESVSPYRLVGKPSQPLQGHALLRIRFRTEGFRLPVQVEYEGPVIDLVGDGKGGVVVVRRSDEPHVLRKHDCSVYHPLWIAVHLRGCDLEDPSILVGKLKERKELGEVVFDPGDVDFVQDDNLQGIGRAGLVE